MGDTADIRWKQRFENFKKAFSQLETAVDLSKKRDLSELEISGLIKAFEFTFELSWNVMKDFLTNQGISGIIGSRDAIRLAFSNSLISDGESWMKMISDRNLASHTYDEKTAQSLFSMIKEKYLGLFKAFSQKMEDFSKES
ncbi:MAG: nucleotidyltransferase substrate binding protein [Treponema sp.]|uniref:nucleotidyltransferase substrate binding protein n=1 Tax=Treponema sp. TaxID=166 RepID=UPI0025E0F87B|nr:nucleotidyltransferase substrate binding protein [Treponema sp.]MBQ9282823.1 nucleotidyltransferase substrate binding protein [Treponema sp.]